MIISVTAEHIRHGIRQSCIQCPVALALQEATAQSTWKVGFSYARLYSRHKSVARIELPLLVQDFIKSFDTTDDHQEPFEFEIDYTLPTEITCE